VILSSAQRLSQVDAFDLAGSLTFTTVLAIVPLLAVALALFTAFPQFHDFSDALQAFLTNSLMPPVISDNVMSYLNDFAKQASRLTAIGGSFLVLTVLLLILSVDKALNDIWRVTKPRGIGQRLLVYWALLTPLGYRTRCPGILRCDLPNARTSGIHSQGLPILC
jgi:membrane protein